MKTTAAKTTAAKTTAARKLATEAVRCARAAEEQQAARTTAALLNAEYLQRVLWETQRALAEAQRVVAEEQERQRRAHTLVLRASDVLDGLRQIERAPRGLGF